MISEFAKSKFTTREFKDLLKVFIFKAVYEDGVPNRGTLTILRKELDHLQDYYFCTVELLSLPEPVFNDKVMLNYYHLGSYQDSLIIIKSIVDYIGMDEATDLLLEISFIDYLDTLMNNLNKHSKTGTLDYGMRELIYQYYLKYKERKTEFKKPDFAKNIEHELEEIRQLIRLLNLDDESKGIYSFPNIITAEEKGLVKYVEPSSIHFIGARNVIELDLEAITKKGFYVVDCYKTSRLSDSVFVAQRTIKVLIENFSYGSNMKFEYLADLAIICLLFEKDLYGAENIKTVTVAYERLIKAYSNILQHLEHLSLASPKQLKESHMVQL